MAKNRSKDLSELLSAYLDGELEESARAEVVAYLDRDAGAVQLLNELRETRSMIQDLPHQSAPAGFSESVVSAVERQALLGGAPDKAGRISTRRRWGPIRAAASIALLVGAAGSWIYWQSDRREFAELALREAAAPSTITGRAMDRPIGPETLASLDGTAEEPSRSNQPRKHMKKSARGKPAARVDVHATADRPTIDALFLSTLKLQISSLSVANNLEQFQRLRTCKLGGDLQDTTAVGQLDRATGTNTVDR